MAVQNQNIEQAESRFSSDVIHIQEFEERCNEVNEALEET